MTFLTHDFSKLPSQKLSTIVHYINYIPSKKQFLQNIPPKTPPKPTVEEACQIKLEETQKKPWMDDLNEEDREPDVLLDFASNLDFDKYVED